MTFASSGTIWIVSASVGLLRGHGSAPRADDFDYVTCSLVAMSQLFMMPFHFQKLICVVSFPVNVLGTMSRCRRMQDCMLRRQA